jgi:hypothetical protein
MKAIVPFTLAELQAAAARQGLTVQQKYGRYRVVRKFALFEPAVEWIEVVAGGGYSLSLDDLRKLLTGTEAGRGRVPTGIKKETPNATELQKKN